MKRALITGVSGQDGAYLSRLLLEKGYAVIGTTRSPAEVPARLVALDIAGQISLVPTPEPSFESWQGLVQSQDLDEIYNLAAQSSVPNGEKKPYVTSMANAFGPLGLLEAVRCGSPQTRVFLASSAQVFGSVTSEVAKVSGPFMPTNLYGASKLFAQQLGELYRSSYGLFVSHGILFAHESPLRGERFLTRKVTKTLAAIRAGAASILEVGNIDAERDWGYAPDFVRAMHASLQVEEGSGYVFASGRVATVREFITLAGKALGFDLIWRGHGTDEVAYDAKTGGDVVRINPEFYRPFQERTPIADIAETQKKLKWSPSYTLEEMISEMCQAEFQAIKGIKTT